MSYKLLRGLLEWPMVAMLIGGIVIAALNVTLAGFTPIMWFLLALWVVLIIICTEVTQIRESLGSKK